MLNLYWKIFLGFWVTSVILVGAAVYINQPLKQSIPTELLGLTPEEYSNRTRLIVKHMPKELPYWREQLSQHDIQIHLITNQPTTLTNRQTPDNITSIIDALDTRELVTDKTLTRVRIGSLNTDEQGQRVKLVLDMPNTLLLRTKEISRHISIQLALALIVSGIVCFFLARYLTRNIQKLSIASRALAKGDLSARVPLPARRSDNDELFKLGSDFNHMADKLEQSIVNQRRLIRDISHELRSPLARLQIALELARQHNNSKELDRIESECNRLNELIGQILSIPDEFGPLEDVIDLCSLINNVIDTCEIESESRMVRINYSSELNEALVLASGELLYRALENIIRNAIRYTPKESSIDIDLTTHLKKRRGKIISMYELNVIDQGPGVPEEELEKIFKPFYRVDHARNRKTGGYGVGLAIVEQAIRQHNGTITARNKHPGLQVRVRFPQTETSAVSNNSDVNY